MKSTDNFKMLIQKQIDFVSGINPVFAKKVANPEKNIDDCITYILNQVKGSGSNGFIDTEIYGFAMHYYEPDVKPGDKVNVSVVVNHHVELTPEEIEELKQKARDKVVADEIAKMKKPVTKKPAVKTAEKAPVKDNTLF